MALKHIEQVLTTAGLPADQFKALNELPDDAPDFKPDAYTAPIRTAVETAVKNDPTFYESLTPESLAPVAPKLLKTIEAAQYGQAADRNRTKLLQAFGYTRKDLGDISDEEFKSPEGFAKALGAKLANGKLTDAEIQKALMAANEKIQKLESEEIPNLSKKYQDEANTTVSERTFELVSLSTLASVEGLNTPAIDLAPALHRELRSRYDWKVDGMDVVPMQKGKNLRAMNANNTKELSLNDAVNAIVDERKWSTKKTSKTTKDEGTSRIDTDGDTGEYKVPAHVAPKMQKLIDSQKTA